MCGHPTGARGYDSTPAGPPPDEFGADDFPELKEAFIAWKAGNYEAMVEASLGVLGISARSPSAPPGVVGWTINVDSAALYIAYRREQGEVMVAAPVVWVPKHQRVGLMRALLELNLWALQAAGFCLYGDVVVLRYSDKAENISPPKLISVVREVGREADRHDNWLAEKFGARMVGPEAQKGHLDWSFLGTEVPLRGFEQAPVGGMPDASPPPSAGLLAMLAEGIRLVGAYDRGRTNAMGRLLCRSMICRAWSEYRQTCPSVATLVLDGGWSVVTAPLGQEPAVSEVLGWLEGLDALGDTLDALAPAPVSAPPGLEVSARDHAVAVLRSVERLPDDPALRLFILLGALGELLARAAIPTEVASRLTMASVWGVQTGPSTNTCTQLVRVLEELA